VERERPVHLLGFAYGATRTSALEGMRRFFGALGIEPSSVVGASATMFRFPDGSFFGVAAPDEPEDAGATGASGRIDGDASSGPDDRRIIGFRVLELEAACAALEAAGFPIIDAHENELSRYAHVEGPDGRLYELVELLPPASAAGTGSGR
jgi:catechol 2,3-dioxygenase-like lactoylglutathione lyase family enzyme